MLKEFGRQIKKNPFAITINLNPGSTLFYLPIFLDKYVTFKLSTIVLSQRNIKKIGFTSASKSFFETGLNGIS